MDLTERQKQEFERLYNTIVERKKNYGLIDFKPQKHQQLLIDAISKVKEEDGNILPYYRFLLFQGGNGAGKSIIALYIVVLLALGSLCKDYGLPFIGSKRNIFIGTKSGDNLKNTIIPYLTGDFSIIRFPPETISKVIQDNGAIKSITLINNTTIKFFTYDQGRERIQGTNGDLYLLDEEPKDASIFTEALARIRTRKAQLLLSFTPLSGYTASYEFFYEGDDESVKQQSYVQVVNSLQNEFADHTWLKGLTEQERKMRLEGMFVPPSGLVYPNFNRNRNTIQYFNPKDLNNVKFYAGLDFGVNHPTAFTPMAIDEDGNIYIFDLIYESNLLIKDLAKKIKQIELKYQISFEYIVADSAGQRERLELKQYGINTVNADKWSRGENGDSNRRAGIMKVNQLLYDGKLYIADNLKPIIKEFENHHYKDNGKDGAVEKTQDDILDSLRYVIFSYKPPKYITNREKEFNKKYGVKYSKRLINNNTNKPY